MGRWITVLLGASLAFVLGMLVTVVLGGRTVDLILLSAGLSFVLGGALMAHLAKVFGIAQPIEDLYAAAEKEHSAATVAYQQLQASRAAAAPAPAPPAAPTAPSPAGQPEAVGVELVPEPSASMASSGNIAAAEPPAPAFPPGPLKMAPRLNSPNSSPWADLSAGDAPPPPRRRRQASLMPWIMLLVVIGGAAAVVVFVPRVRELIPFLKSEKPAAPPSSASPPKATEGTTPKEPPSSKPESSLPDVKPAMP
jgi:hypothetical protein